MPCRSPSLNWDLVNSGHSAHICFLNASFNIFLCMKFSFRLINHEVSSGTLWETIKVHLILFLSKLKKTGYTTLISDELFKVDRQFSTALSPGRYKKLHYEYDLLSKIKV